MIIGLTGTNGAGKGTIASYLQEHYQFQHLQARDVLITLLQQRNLPIDRTTMREVANELRATNGPSALMQELWKLADSKGENVIFESVRTIGEVAWLRTQPGFVLWAADADPQTRYCRIVDRQSSTDQVSYEEFIHQEHLESISTDPDIQNIQHCLRLADHVFLNNGGYEDLYRQVDEVMRSTIQERIQ